MKEKFIVTIRFHTKGKEAELYQRILEEKQEAGLSLPEYLKQILMEYFSEQDRQKREEQWWELLQKEYKEMLDEIKQMIYQCLSEHDMAVMGVLVKMVKGENGAVITAGGRGNAELPEESEDIPEGALNFLEESWE